MPPELGKAALRLLRALASEGALLVDDGGGLALEGVRGETPTRAAFDALRRRDLLEAVPQPGAARRAHRLGAVGRALLRRLEGGEDPFRSQHRLEGERHIEAAHTANRRFGVNEGESPLGWLARRKGADGTPFLSALQVEAGERLRRDFTLAGMQPRVTASWGPPSGTFRAAPGPGLDPREHAIAAKARLERALAAVGPGLGDVLLEICCFLNGLEEAERTLGWPQRSAKVVLAIALDRLAAHYGLGRGGAPSPMRSFRAP